MSIALWIIALLSILALGYFTWRSDKRRGVPYPWLTAGLRSLLLALLWALILAPGISLKRTETRQPVVVFLQDESASIPLALKGDTNTYTSAARSLVKRLSEKYRVVTWGFGSAIRSDSLFRYEDAATDISAPLARVRDFYGSQNLGAVILASDGRFNQGLHPLYQNLAWQSPVYAVSIGDTSVPADLRITAVYAPRRVAKDAQVEIRVDLVASRLAGYTGSLRLREGSAESGRIPLSIGSDRFDRAVSFNVKPGAAGLHHYTIEAEPAEREINRINNRKDVFIEVTETRKRIVLAAAAPHPDLAAIREALAGTDAYTLTTRIGAGLPPASEYDVLILHGLPAMAPLEIPAHKAVWYIVSQTTGRLSSPAAAAIQLQPAVTHDAYPTLNSSFSAFTLPPGLGALTERLPPLSSANGTITPAGGTQSLFTDKTGTQGLWLVQPGNAPQAILLGEGLWRWRLYEYRYTQSHNVIDECIRQTIAMLAANASDAPLRVELPKYEWSDGENISLNAYLLNAAGQQINTPDIALRLSDSSGKTQAFSFERNGSGYRLNIGQLPPGSYRYTATAKHEGRELRANGAFIVVSVPLESLETGADFPLLNNLAKNYGGSAVTAAQMASLYDSITRNPNIRPVLESREQHVPLIDWKWYFFLILLVAAAEWLIRKYWLAM
jgi:hypothetical protein